MFAEAHRDTRESEVDGLQQFEDVMRIFRKDSGFNWQTREVIKDLMSNAFVDSVCAAMVPSSNDRTTNIVDHFILTLHLIEHVQGRQI